MSSAASSTSQRRVFIITGSNTGVGLAAARALTSSDITGERHIILACRTASKAQAAVDLIKKETPKDQKTIVEWMQLDLADYDSIVNFTTEFKRRSLPLHVLLNNAGVNVPPRVQPSSFKIDGQFTANYLGHYILTKELLPVLESSAPSRVINVSSYMHRTNSTTDFRKQCRLRNGASYSTSKLAQIYHSYAIQREYGKKGVTAFVVHPGACNSDIWNTLRPACLRRVIKPVAASIFLTTEQGAAPLVHAATKTVSEDKEECEHFGPYSCWTGWEKYFDSWQPSSWSKVSKSKTHPITYDTKIGDSLMQLSDELSEEWAAAAKAQKKESK